MVKVTGPAMSIEASGQLGNVLVAARWKGRPYIRSLTKPTNKKTPAQTGIRAMMQFLSQRWKPLGAIIQATWIDLAKTTNVSPFNAYIAHNMRRWREGRGPTQGFPATESFYTPAVTLTAAGSQRHANLSVTPEWDVGINGIMICRDTAPISAPTWRLAIKILFFDTGDGQNWTDAPLAEGTYYYMSQAFNTNGSLSPNPSTCEQALVT